MTLFSVLTFHEQGMYDVVNNIGSLAARFLFRPVEESSYFYFSQLIHRDKPIKEQNMVCTKNDKFNIILNINFPSVITTGIVIYITL